MCASGHKLELLFAVIKMVRIKTGQLFINTKICFSKNSITAFKQCNIFNWTGRSMITKKSRYFVYSYLT